MRCETWTREDRNPSSRDGVTLQTQPVFVDEFGVGFDHRKVPQLRTRSAFYANYSEDAIPCNLLMQVRCSRRRVQYGSPLSTTTGECFNTIIHSLRTSAFASSVNPDQRLVTARAYGFLFCADSRRSAKRRFMHPAHDQHRWDLKRASFRISSVSTRRSRKEMNKRIVALRETFSQMKSYIFYERLTAETKYPSDARAHGRKMITDVFPSEILHAQSGRSCVARLRCAIRY
jgi:hypothetical protein